MLLRRTTMSCPKWYRWARYGARPALGGGGVLARAVMKGAGSCGMRCELHRSGLLCAVNRQLRTGAERKLLECLLGDGGLVHGESW